MSTYNGERFLAQQLDSIIAQTYTDWRLLIRDDGSSDGTRGIIADYVAKDERICWVDQDSQENLGVIKSFHRLVKLEDADVYLFSDQDDVWLSDKVASQLELAQRYPVEEPLLVYMDLKVVDDSLHVLEESMIKRQSHHANTSLEAILIENTVTGGVTLINHALAQRWTRTDGLIMHDWYLAILAASLGHLVYLDQPGELYRQHSQNVVGARTQDKRFKLFREGPRTVYQRYWRHIHEIQDQARTVLAEVGDRLSPDQHAILTNWISIDQQPLSERYRRLKTYGYRKNKRLHQLVFTSLILSKIYHQ
nr:glycosyltransferase family 2 protein [Streptococcus ovuberis]